MQRACFIAEIAYLKKRHINLRRIDNMNQKILPAAAVLAFLFLSGTVSGLSSVVVNGKSCLVVLFGTLICGLIAYPGRTVVELGNNMRNMFRARDDYKELIGLIENLARIRRSQGIKALEAESAKLDNRFLRQGIEMVADGYDRNAIFNTLEKRYENFLASMQSQKDLLSTFTKLSPVFGFVGTIMGLIDVLNNMGSPEVIGRGMATALLTTFYGLLFANMLFLPLSRKFAENMRCEAVKRSLVMEGVMDMADNINSKSISYRLHASLGDHFSESGSDCENRLSGFSLMAKFRKIYSR